MGCMKPPTPRVWVITRSLCKDRLFGIARGCWCGGGVAVQHSTDTLAIFVPLSLSLLDAKRPWMCALGPLTQPTPRAMLRRWCACGWKEPQPKSLDSNFDSSHLLHHHVRPVAQRRRCAGSHAHAKFYQRSSSRHDVSSIAGVRLCHRAHDGHNVDVQAPPADPLQS